MLYTNSVNYQMHGDLYCRVFDSDASQGVRMKNISIHDNCDFEYESTSNYPNNRYYGNCVYSNTLTDSHYFTGNSDYECSMFSGISIRITGSVGYQWNSIILVLRTITRW